MVTPRSALPVLICAAALATAGSALARSAESHRAAVPSAHAARGCGRTSLTPRRSNLRLLAQITLCLINRQRGAHGLRPLQPDGALTRAARGHSADMVNRAYFSHDTPQGVNPFQRMGQSGYRRACALGENLAAATGPFSTPASIVRMWMNSPDHRANILSRSYRDTGMGVAFGYPGAQGYRGATYTEDFGAHC